MTAAQIIVTLLGLALSGGIALFFWGPRQGGFRVPVSTSGYQEAMILVKGGYTPNVIVVEHGRPVRLNFRREESAGCSDTLVFADFNKSVHLPTGEVVPIEFLPEKPGEYAFGCQMGMYLGKLVVE